MKNVGVFFGGKSTENEISIITGVMTLNVLDKEKYKVIPIYLDTNGTLKSSDEMFSVEGFKGRRDLFYDVILKDGYLYKFSRWRAKPIAKLDVGINCCHGICGEDGYIASLLKVNDIANCSPNLIPSAVFMDKSITRMVSSSLGINTPPFIKVNEVDFEKRSKVVLRYIERSIAYPLIIKPNLLGSSIGITIANDENELEQSILNAFKYDSSVIVEKYIEKKIEVNCACYKSDGQIFVSNCDVPLTTEKFYTLEEKYLKGNKGTENKSKVILCDEQIQKIQAYTKLLYKKFDFNGIVRADFLVSEGEVYFNELNAVPGSLAYYMFCSSFGEFKDLLDRLIVESEKRYKMEKNKIVDLKLGVLDNFNKISKYKK